MMDDNEKVESRPNELTNVPSSVMAATTENKRAIFSDHERNVLLALVERRKYVIESKKTDFASTKKKQQAWDEVTADFNSQSHVIARNAKQLKKCWENVKARAKKEVRMMAMERRGRMRTVGGNNPLFLSDGSLQVMAIMQPNVQHVDDDFDDVDDDLNSAVLPDRGPPEMITVKAEAMDIMADLDDWSESRNSNLDEPRSSSRNTNQDTNQDDSNDPAIIGTQHRVTYIHKTLATLEEQKRKLTIQILREQRSFQMEEHERKTRILQLKEENQIRKRKILKLQETYWQSNLRNRFSVNRDAFD